MAAKAYDLTRVGLTEGQAKLLGIESGSNYKNVIIGGDFTTNPWQRGTSFAAAASDAYYADRWKYYCKGVAVHTLTRNTSGPSFTECDLIGKCAFRADVTTGDTSIGATDLFRLATVVEGFNYAKIAQRNTTLSFWVKAHRNGIYSYSLTNSGADRSITYEYTVREADVWQRVVQNILPSPSGGTWNYTTGAGIEISFWGAAGANFVTSTLNVWQSAAGKASSNQINAINDDHDYIALALVQLEAGDVATYFEDRDALTEFNLCARYFLIWPCVFSSTITLTNTFFSGGPFRIAPTITLQPASGTGATAGSKTVTTQCGVLIQVYQSALHSTNPDGTITLDAEVPA